MSDKNDKDPYKLVKSDGPQLLKSLEKEHFVETLRKMCRIRNFELRAEAAYQQGKIGGFFHAYTGQEAIQTACVDVLGLDPWYIATYRCHAIALLTGVTPNEAMAELYGKANGNAKGRGGSMHLYSDKLLGGFGIVGGHLPIAAGAAFTIKYNNEKNLAVCFLGDGAVAQGAVYETLNYLALWDLPCLVVIENNQWGMGTAVDRAIAMHPIAEGLAPAFHMEGYSVNGMDYLDCYECFKMVSEKILETGKPILLEALTERFKGHSISDPGLYRSKDELKEAMGKDPILALKTQLISENILTEEEFKAIDKEEKDLVVESLKYAEEGPWPDLLELEEEVFAEDE